MLLSAGAAAVQSTRVRWGEDNARDIGRRRAVQLGYRSGALTATWHIDPLPQTVRRDLLIESHLSLSLVGLNF